MRRLKNIVILGITLVAIGATAVGTGVGALEYKSNTVPLTFQFDTTMTVSLSGSSLVIDELSPNTAKNSNTVDVTVVTNDVTGYTLKATTGDASNTTTNLVAENGTFGMIGSEESALSVGKWGYTIDGGTTFGALALYTATPTTVNASNAPTDATTGKTAFQIGAYASPSQAAGDYTNVVNFIAVANSVVTDGTYMQDVTSQSLATMLPNVGDKTTLYDKRDNQAYRVARLGNEEYWMVQNLRYVGDAANSSMTLSTTDSNVSANVTSLKYYSLDSDDASYAGHCDSGNSYNYACIKDSGNLNTGVWYNYYAATAGTVGGASNETLASQGICPKGWYLPSSDDLQILIGNSISGEQSVAALEKFNPVVGGTYGLGVLDDTEFGSWWTGSSDGTTLRYVLGYNGSNNKYSSTNTLDRSFGGFVRCRKVNNGNPV